MAVEERKYLNTLST